MPTFSTSLSGLNANSVALNVIANNLANLNTVGFKATRPMFQDLFYQQIGNSGSGNPIQVGVGANVAGIGSLFTQGSIESSGVPTDVAIQGDGLFITDKSGLQMYTRAGNFSVDATGQLLTQDGAQVQGYNAVNGIISPSQTLGPLSIPTGLTSPPKPTTNVQLSLNLDASAASPVAAVSAASQQTGTGIAPATVLQTGSVLTISDGTHSATYTTAASDTLSQVASAINANANFTASISGNSLVITATSGTPVTFTTNTLTDAAAGTQAETFVASGTAVTGVAAGSFSTPVAVYDALGATHVLAYNFTKTGANTWAYTVSIPAADVGATGNPVTINSGTLTFNGAGQLTSPGTNLTGLTISGLADGANPLTFNWNLYSPTGGGLLTQVSGPSATSSTQQDGYGAGTLVSFTIGSDGIIQGIFSNGQTIPIGQLALANFPNVQGLLRNGSNEFLASLASGAPNVGAPGTGGRGSINGGALEQSNVDIATEFAKLILAQRGYQANARAVTTFDEVTQEAINLKR
jgi:flagellar hook protein FlgE